MPSRTIAKIKLQSDDRQIFDVSQQTYKFFNTIMSMVEGPFRTTKIELVIPVPDVNASCLEKVLEWAEYHMDDDPLEENDGCIPDIGEWDRKLLQVERNVLMELILASDYLGNQRLLDITSRAVIDLIKNEPARNVEDSSTLDGEQQQKDYVVEYETDSESNDDDK
ncbi:S-phase kinase-associated protein 1-like [Aedes albopictus]|uniref:SKP1 component POZ domain-containing protein n=1 Tax=Aedes albopictus TaxID=7160 RepID=A0ABM1Z0V1_AEDAL|nr:S-phase kinase-associated protein 1-like [Aedes albopictus]